MVESSGRAISATKEKLIRDYAKRNGFNPDLDSLSSYLELNPVVPEADLIDDSNAVEAD